MIMRSDCSSPSVRCFYRFALLLVAAIAANAAAAQGVALTAARTAGSDHYTIELDGSNFGASAYVNIIYPGSSTIAAQYIGSPPLTRWTSGGLDHLSFVVTDPAQRNQLNNGGFNLYVVNPTNGSFDGPRLLVRTPPPNQNPTVAITAPANNATFGAPAAITISATASDPDGNGIQVVEFYNGNTLLGQDTSAPYSYAWSGVAAGSYTLKAVAYDGLGAASSPAQIAVTVTATNVALTAARTTGSDLYTIELDGSNFGASAYVNIIYPGSSTIAAQYIGSPPLTRWTSGGLDHLSFVVTDPAQRNQLNTGGFNLYVVNPTNGSFDGPRLLVRSAPPSHTVAIVAPTPDQWFPAPASITITATATNPDGAGIQRVDFFNGPTLLGQDSTAPYTYTWTGASIGNYELRAIAYNGNGAASPAASVPVSVVSANFQPVLNRGGSHLNWYYVPPESQGCVVEDYALINDYHRMSPFNKFATVRSLVQSQLAQMYQSGQRSITYNLYLAGSPPPNYGSIDAFGVQTLTHQSFMPQLPTKYLDNVRDAVSDAVAAGLTEVTIRFLWDGGSGAPYTWSGAYRSDLADGWKQAIADVKASVASTGATLSYDLGGELMPLTVPANTSPSYTVLFNLHRWGQELWAWYVANYGAADSVGFSVPSGTSPNFPLAIARADLQLRLGAAPTVYGATFPAAIDIHFYEDVPTLYADADAYFDSISKPDIPFRVGETFYNDANVADQLKRAAAKANRSVERVAQWPLLGPQRASDDDGNYCDHVTLVPLGYSEYLLRGF
jgi:hypothetical protein